MEELRRDSAFEPIANKVAKVYGIKPELAMDLLEFAALAHDVGKVDVAYKNAVKYFPLHEARSADFAYYVLTRAGLMGTNSFEAEDVGNAVVIVVALHHYSHKTPRVDATAGGFKARCDAHIEAFSSWTPRTAEGDTLKSYAVQTRNVGRYGVYTAVLKAIHGINNKTKLRASAAAILGLLNKADGAVASRNRRRTP